MTIPTFSALNVLADDVKLNYGVKEDNWKVYGGITAGDPVYSTVAGIVTKIKTDLQNVDYKNASSKKQDIFEVLYSVSKLNETDLASFAKETVSAGGKLCWEVLVDAASYAETVDWYDNVLHYLPDLKTITDTNYFVNYGGEDEYDLDNYAKIFSNFTKNGRDQLTASEAYKKYADVKEKCEKISAKLVADCVDVFNTAKAYDLDTEWVTKYDEMVDYVGKTSLDESDVNDAWSMLNFDRERKQVAKAVNGDENSEVYTKTIAGIQAKLNTFANDKLTEYKGKLPTSIANITNVLGETEAEKKNYYANVNDTLTKATVGIIPELTSALANNTKYFTDDFSDTYKDELEQMKKACEYWALVDALSKEDYTSKKYDEQKAQLELVNQKYAEIIDDNKPSVVNAHDIYETAVTNNNNARSAIIGALVTKVKAATKFTQDPNAAVLDNAKLAAIAVNEEKSADFLAKFAEIEKEMENLSTADAATISSGVVDLNTFNTGVATADQLTQYVVNYIVKGRPFVESIKPGAQGMISFRELISSINALGIGEETIDKIGTIATDCVRIDTAGIDGEKIDTYFKKIQDIKTAIDALGANERGWYDNLISTNLNLSEIEWFGNYVDKYEEEWNTLNVAHGQVLSALNDFKTGVDNDIKYLTISSDPDDNKGASDANTTIDGVLAHYTDAKNVSKDYGTKLDYLYTETVNYDQIKTNLDKFKTDFSTFRKDVKAIDDAATVIKTAFADTVDADIIKASDDAALKNIVEEYLEINAEMLPDIVNAFKDYSDKASAYNTSLTTLNGDTANFPEFGAIDDNDVFSSAANTYEQYNKLSKIFFDNYFNKDDVEPLNANVKGWIDNVNEEYKTFESSLTPDNYKNALDKLYNETTGLKTRFEAFDPVAKAYIQFYTQDDKASNSFVHYFAMLALASEYEPAYKYEQKLSAIKKDIADKLAVSDSADLRPAQYSTDLGNIEKDIEDLKSYYNGVAAESRQRQHIDEYVNTLDNTEKLSSVKKGIDDRKKAFEFDSAYDSMSKVYTSITNYIQFYTDVFKPVLDKYKDISDSKEQKALALAYDNFENKEQELFDSAIDSLKTKINGKTFDNSIYEDVFKVDETLYGKGKSFLENVRKLLDETITEKSKTAIYDAKKNKLVVELDDISCTVNAIDLTEQNIDTVTNFVSLNSYIDFLNEASKTVDETGVAINAAIAKANSLKVTVAENLIDSLPTMPTITGLETLAELNAIKPAFDVLYKEFDEVLALSDRLQIENLSTYNTKKAAFDRKYNDIKLAEEKIQAAAEAFDKKVSELPEITVENCDDLVTPTAPNQAYEALDNEYDSLDVAIQNKITKKSDLDDYKSKRDEWADDKGYVDTNINNPISVLDVDNMTVAQLDSKKSDVDGIKAIIDGYKSNDPQVEDDSKLKFVKDSTKETIDAFYNKIKDQKQAVSDFETAVKSFYDKHEQDIKDKKVKEFAEELCALEKQYSELLRASEVKDAELNKLTSARTTLNSVYSADNNKELLALASKIKEIQDNEITLDDEQKVLDLEKEFGWLCRDHKLIVNDTNKRVSEGIFSDAKKEIAELKRIAEEEKNKKTPEFVDETIEAISTTYGVTTKADKVSLIDASNVSAIRALVEEAKGYYDNCKDQTAVTKLQDLEDWEYAITVYDNRGNVTNPDGKLDGDELDVLDIQEMLNIALKSVSVPKDSAKFDVADINHDGEVDIFDILEAIDIIFE